MHKVKVPNLACGIHTDCAGERRGGPVHKSSQQGMGMSQSLVWKKSLHTSLHLFFCTQIQGGPCTFSDTVLHLGPIFSSRTSRDGQIHLPPFHHSAWPSVLFTSWLNVVAFSAQNFKYQNPEAHQDLTIHVYASRFSTV
jgi:hypothetical protein